MGAFLILGFTLHNVTEGIAIAAPILKERPPLGGILRIGNGVVRVADAQGQPPGGWMPEQRLPLEQAFAAFTRGAAHAYFRPTSCRSTYGRMPPCW